jgi:hypothetical protein
MSTTKTVNPTEPPAEPTREVALRNGKGTVLVREEFANRFPALAPTEEMMAVFEENLGDETLGVSDFKVVKVPSGELNSWVVTKGGEETSVRELVGVVVAIRQRRSFWQGEGDPDGSFPDCTSADGKTPQPGGMYAPDGEMGASNPRGTCKTCPMYQRGSDKNGASKCREQRLFFLMVNGAMFPTVVQVPRTSIKGARGYAMELAEDGLPYYSVETAMGLTKAKNTEGTAYNKITFRSAGKLTEAERQAAQVFGQEIKDMVDQAAADFSEAATAEAAGSGISVGDSS